MSEFTETVARRVPSLAVGDRCDEFSSKRCESCGTRMAGERHEATHCSGKGCEITRYTICTDCALYHANGDEPEVWP